MSNSENVPFPDFQRYHDPSLPLIRSRLQKIVLWFFEFLIIGGVYYFLSVDGTGISRFSLYAANATILQDFPLHFWFSLWFAFTMAKIFKRTASILGVVSAEILIEWLHFPKINLLIVIYVGVAILIESLQPYNGGEYYKGSKILTQIGLSISYILVFMAIFYIWFEFSPYQDEEFSESLARGYLLLNFMVNSLFLIIPSWFTMFILDRELAPFFPLSTTESEVLSKIEDDFIQDVSIDEEMSGDDWDLDQFLPKPGEVYVQLLTHHPLDQDDHTIVIKLGKVRLYLCTRCTAMILGVISTLILTRLIIYEFDLPLSSTLAFWLGISLPIFPLLDWGLQALRIRKATTTSRLITGFILGACMQLLSFTHEFFLQVILVVAVYFIIFGILAWLRKKKQGEFDSKKALLDKIDPEQ